MNYLNKLTLNDTRARLRTFSFQFQARINHLFRILKFSSVPTPIQNSLDKYVLPYIRVL